MALRSHRELVAWKKAMELVVEIYRRTKLLPKGETYGLRIQLERAAVSIPANIAEGYGRMHWGEYVHHLSIANGSLKELDTLLEIASALKYLPEEEIQKVRRLLDEEGRILYGLISSLRVPHHHPVPGTPIPVP